MCLLGWSFFHRCMCLSRDTQNCLKMEINNSYRIISRMINSCLTFGCISKICNLASHHRKLTYISLSPHYIDDIMTTVASQTTSACQGQLRASPGPVNSPHKGPVTRKMFPFDDVIMSHISLKTITVIPWFFSVCPSISHIGVPLPEIDFWDINKYYRALIYPKVEIMT